LAREGLFKGVPMGENLPYCQYDEAEITSRFTYFTRKGEAKATKENLLEWC
jgi:hypothetical protein